MELKVGYKQSEVGVIPDNWIVEKLGYCLKNKPDYGIGAAAVKYNDNLFTYLRITDISDDGKFLKTNLASVDNPNSENYILNENEIVVARTGASVGKTYLYKKEDGKLIFAGFLIRLRPEPSKISSQFLFAITQSKHYKNWILGNSMRSGQPGINSNQLNGFIIPLPPLLEQTAIANALSDMDALISQTEKLIEKKKAIKQGVMQELLKPKDGWVTKKLGDIGKTYGGLTGKSKVDFANGNAFYIPFMNVMSSPTINLNFFDSVHIRSGEKQNKAIKGDLFFNGSSETPEEVGMCSVLTQQIDNLYLNSFCFGYRLNDTETYNGLFLAYYFRSDFGRAAIFSLAQGATRYNLSKGNFLKMEIPIPEFNTQNEIAGCIADMDSELKKITVKLTKLKQQKQGMMQALLTGKIRLVS
jgi:type I restriction enzyme S subunit